MLKKPTKDKTTALPVCTKEKLYDVLIETYTALEHPGMTAFWDELSSLYSWIPQHFSECFVKHCKINVENKACEKSVAAKPIIATKFMTRVEADLIHMGILEGEVYRYVCHARDHFTKWSWAAPLKTKEAKEVAQVLRRIFLLFGPPTVFHTDNGTEFTSQVIRDLMNDWPETRIVRGRPRHPQSQGLIEKGNSVLKGKLAKWMQRNRSTLWSQGLDHVIYAMNTSYCRVTKFTPYELVFGQKPRANLRLLNDLPEDTVVDESNLNLEFEELIYPTDYHLEMEENEEIENENSITEIEVSITL